MAFKSKKVKKWDDGDSGVFVDGTRFRLNGVRAHESHQFGGSTATRRVAGMTGRTSERVQVEQVARDRYGRAVVNMKNKDGSVNKRMRENGYKNKGR